MTATRPPGGSVFLVEDEVMIRMMVADMLEELGFGIAAEAGEINEAIRLAQSTEFDLAILDVNVNGKVISPVAELIAARNRPFIFARAGLGRGNVRNASGRPGPSHTIACIVAVTRNRRSRGPCERQPRRDGGGLFVGPPGAPQLRSEAGDSVADGSRGNLQSGCREALEIALRKSRAAKSICDGRRFQYAAKQDTLGRVRANVRARNRREIAFRRADDADRRNRDTSGLQLREVLVQCGSGDLRERPFGFANRRDRAFPGHVHDTVIRLEQRRILGRRKHDLVLR